MKHDMDIGHDAVLPERFASVLSVEFVESRGRVAKHLLILASVALMVFYEWPPAILLFSPFYLLLDYSYKWHVEHSRRKAEIGRAAFRLLLAHHFTLVKAFALLAVFNAFGTSQIAHIAAVMLMVAQAFHCISIETRSRDVTWLAIVAMAFSAQAVAVGITLDGYALSEQLFVQLSATLLTIFFAQVTLTAAGTRLALEERSRQLLMAQKGETVGRLTSGIAHDFNNLLTVMRGNIDLFPEVREEERDALLAEIGAATDRGGRLISRLLASGRRSPAADELIDVAAFFAGFAAFARRVLPANVAIDVSTVGAPMLRAEASQFEAALLNLVVNARDAMPGGGTIAMLAQPADPPDAEGGDWISVTVADDGRGMTPDVLSRATEAFMTTKPPGVGSGLGLSMVRGFAEELGGTLTLESRAGSGTTVRLHLPTGPQ